MFAVMVQIDGTTKYLTSDQDWTTNTLDALRFDSAQEARDICKEWGIVMSPTFRLRIVVIGKRGPG